MFGVTYTPADEAFRAELRAWLEARVPRSPLPEDEAEDHPSTKRQQREI